MSPAAPAIEAIIEQKLYSFCQTDVFRVSLPVCRSQRSRMKAMSKVTTVTVDMAMKRGLSPCAPMSVASASAS